MLTKFRVSNYKCLVDVELPLTPVHVLIGQNDSGKTSLLEAMLALSRTAEVSLTDALSGVWLGRELVNETAKSPEIELSACYDAGQMPEFCYYLGLEFPGTERICRRRHEWIEQPERVDLPLHAQDWSKVGFRLHADSPSQRTQLEAIAEKMGPAFLYRLDPKWMATPAAIDSVRKFRMDPDGFGLPTLLDDLLGYEPERFISLRKEFCGYFPQFRTVRIETEMALARRLDQAGTMSNASQNTGKAIFFETIHGRTVRAQQASDGAILFLGLLALMHAPNPPKLLLLEEPEKGVYPKRLEEIIRIIKGLHATRPPGTVPQIVMTTHSPYLLSFFEPEEVTLLSRRDKTGPVRARPLRDAARIHERLGSAFYLGELWYNLDEEDLFGDA